MPLTPEDEQRVKSLILEGKKIEAIKVHREATGLGLKESKEAVEKIADTLKQESPEKFQNVKSGCFSVILLGALLPLTAYFTWLRLL